MSKKEDIRHLWREGFRESDEYLDMYFDRIYRDGDALTVSVEDKLVSTLLMQPYELWFYGREVPMTYIAGCVTRRSARGRGHMTRLIEEVLQRSAAQGDMLCALIPAHDWLYFFFDRFGFSTVFLSDTQRFTSLHTFATEKEYHKVADCYSDAVYDAFVRFERQREGGILHSHRDFLNVLDDLAMQPDGTFVAVGCDEHPVAGMAWAVGKGEILQVNEVLGIDDDARRGAMQQLRQAFPNRSIRYLAPADNPSHRHLYSRGMARVVNVAKCLEVIAGANPAWRCRIRIHDHLLPENNHIYAVADGGCRISDSASGRLDFDVDIDTFNKILFSSPTTGDILGFPCRRTHISLMPR